MDESEKSEKELISEIQILRKRITQLESEKNCLIVNSSKKAAVEINDKSSERIQSESLYKESEYLLRESQRIGNVGSYILNIKTNSWTSSQTLDEIFGISSETLKTIEIWNSILHPEHKEGMLNYFLNEVIALKRTFNKEYKIIRLNDGKERWVWGQGELKFDDDGNPIQMMGTIQDITDRKIHELKLKASEMQYKQIVEHASEGILVYDKNMNIIQANSVAVHDLGYSHEELLGLNAFELLEPNDLKEKSY